MRKPDASAAKRLSRLSAISATKRDADLAHLAQLAQRLSKAESARVELDMALRAEIDVAIATGQLDAFRALDAHFILAEQVRSVIDREIAAVKTLWLCQRDQCVRSFGRAAVLDLLGKTIAHR